MRATVIVHYRRSRLNQVLGAEERLGPGVEDAAFHSIVLQLLKDHNHEVAIPDSAATERIMMTILRAVVDLGPQGRAAVRDLPSSEPCKRYAATCGMGTKKTKALGDSKSSSFATAVRIGSGKLTQACDDRIVRFTVIPSSKLQIHRAGFWNRAEPTVPDIDATAKASE